MTKLRQHSPYSPMVLRTALGQHLKQDLNKYSIQIYMKYTYHGAQIVIILNSTCKSNNELHKHLKIL